jgi:hypothetical protein
MSIQHGKIVTDGAMPLRLPSLEKMLPSAVKRAQDLQTTYLDRKQETDSPGPHIRFGGFAYRSPGTAWQSTGGTPGPHPTPFLATRPATNCANY